jgi:hypothetical protein
MSTSTLPAAPASDQKLPASLPGKPSPPVLKDLPPVNSRFAPVRQPLPVIRVMAQAIPQFAEFLVETDDAGNVKQPPTRTGGQFSLIRLLVVDNRKRSDSRDRARECWVTNAMPSAHWGIKPFERLANPGALNEAGVIDSIVPEAVSEWKRIHTVRDAAGNQHCPEFPVCYLEDCRLSEFRQLAYGMVEVLFESEQEMLKVAEALGTKELVTYDPLTMNDLGARPTKAVKGSNRVVNTAMPRG